MRVRTESQQPFTRMFAIAATAALCCFVAARPANAQAVGQACSPIGSSTSYEFNGVLICGPKGTWRTLVKPVQAGSFGQDAGLVSLIGQRLSNGMNALITAIQQEIDEIMQ